MIDKVRPLPAELPLAARDAWLAYRSMLDSKQAHYGYLESLDRKYRLGGMRTFAERARLETLLAAHDLCVKKFACEIKSLAAADIRARDVLLGLMSEIGEDTAGNIQ